MLELTDLTRRYGEVIALDGLSFTVGPGQLFGFVGANGAGKTTTMRIVMGLDAPDGGRVRWRGQPITLDTRRRFGYMPEERGLYPKMPAASQLAYFGRLHGMARAAADAAARRWLDRLGLAERADDRVEQLSLGNQQRVQLAATVVHEPELLILDEPFSGLDPVGVDALSDILVDIAAGGVPVLFSSHQLELVEQLCQAVAIIDGGRLVASGTVDALRRQGQHDRWRVGVAAADRTWVERLPGVAVHAVEDEAVVVELRNGADPTTVLDAARAAGPVRWFAPVVPTLAERYREVVTRDRP